MINQNKKNQLSNLMSGKFSILCSEHINLYFDFKTSKKILMKIELFKFIFSITEKYFTFFIVYRYIRFYNSI